MPACVFAPTIVYLEANPPQRRTFPPSFGTSSDASFRTLTLTAEAPGVKYGEKGDSGRDGSLYNEEVANKSDGAMGGAGAGVAGCRPS